LDDAYHQETESARAALARAEPAIATTRAAVASIESEAGKSADKAQEASRGLASVMKAALTAQARLKEITILVNETDAVTNRFRLTPLKERLKSVVDSLQRLDADAGQTDQLKDVKALANTLSEAFLRERTGLFALRTEVLAGKKEQEAAYAKQRGAIVQPIEDATAKLNGLVDTLEVQIVKQRQSLELALRFRNEPGGVVAASDSISLDMKEMTASIRLLMLAATEAEARAAESALTALGQRMAAIDRLRAGLRRWAGRSWWQCRRRSVALPRRASIGKVAPPGGVIASWRVAQALAQLKQVAAAGRKRCAQVKRPERQREVIASVDSRVDLADADPGHLGHHTRWPPR
jgi:hypothetical protein